MIRIVKLSFHQEHCASFEALFEEKKNYIANFPGCTSVKLLKENNESGIYFTYSYWDSPASLEAYRNSELFNTTWKQTKLWFNNKPEAWSVDIGSQASRNIGL